MRPDRVAAGVLVALFLVFFVAFEIYVAEPHRERLRACELVEAGR